MEKIKEKIVDTVCCCDNVATSSQNGNDNEEEEVLARELMTKCVVVIAQEDDETTVHKGTHDVQLFADKNEKQCEDDDGGEDKKGVALAQVVVNEEKWIMHYSSAHKILLVGEGDFSFSAALAVAFGNASNMIATSLDSHDSLIGNYVNAISNIVELSRRGCKVMHGVDATDMPNHPLLMNLTFDCIVFNFPYAGPYGSTSSSTRQRRHRAFLREFLQSAQEMIGEDGQIHITHPTNAYLTSLAERQGLGLVQSVDFDIKDYPGYVVKRGVGGDYGFHHYPSNISMFRIPISSCF